MHLIYSFIILLATWHWGDWRNWQKYYPTILFYILCDLLYNFLTYNHPLWLYHEDLLPHHTAVSLLVMFVCYPGTILIYLHQLFKTDDWRKKVFYYFLWVGLYVICEMIHLRFDLISHHNGWSMFYSAPFVMAMFIIFPIHHKKPLWAWGITIIILTCLWIQFDFPKHLK